MRCTISRDQFITALEWVLFIGLCIISGLFSSGVVDQFLSGKTSFTQYEEPITIHPAIVIRFSLKTSEVNFSDVNISYVSIGFNEKLYERNLSIGKNYFSRQSKGGNNLTAVVSLESLETNQDSRNKELRGFRIIHLTPMTFNTKGLGGALIKVYHHLRNVDQSKSWENDQILLTFTSINNSPGVRRVWKDGTPLHFIVGKNTNIRLDMKAEQYRFLEQKGKCQQESFYECFISELESSDYFKTCSKKCIPNVFSNLGKNYSIPFCENDIASDRCTMKIVFKIIVHSPCKKSCSMLQYLGQFAENHPDRSIASDKSNYYRLEYKFPNKNMYVSEEYFIYDIMNVIGSVGGTLGMFIGFSMTGFISLIFTKLRI